MTTAYLLYLGVWAGVSLTLLITTFVLYAALTHMKAVQRQLDDGSPLVRWVCYFILGCGLVSNTALNWWFLTITYYELPIGVSLKNGRLSLRFETLSTGRIVRHKYESDGVRQTQSLWWCRYWLTPFDVEHCERVKT